MSKNLWQPIVTFLCVVFLLAACAPSGDGISFLPSTRTPKPTATPKFTATPQPTSTPTRAPATATPEIGLGIPLAGGSWQVTIHEVKQVESLSSSMGIGKTTYTPKPGYAFLVVNLTLRSLKPAQSEGISSSAVSVTDENGEIHPASGGGFSESSMCVGCMVVMTSSTKGLTASFVFTVKSDLIEKPWKLQFKDSAPLAFTIKDKAAFPYKTEIGATSGTLPDECDLKNIQPPPDKTGLLTFERWENAGLVVGKAIPAGPTTTPICSGLAIAELKWSGDGAVLLVAAPSRGWPSLSLVEPDGKITALIKNGLNIWASFDPSGRYVLFSTSKLGETGAELHVYDRQAGASQLLKQGKGLAARFLAGEKLLVSASAEKGAEVYLGNADGSSLSLLTLPKGAQSSHITADGEHLIYTKGNFPDQTLVFSKLDGSEEQEITASKQGSGMRGTLSLNGTHVLYIFPQAKGKDAILLNLDSNQSQTIASGQDELKLAFSPDGRWALVFGTLRGKSGSDSQAKTETKYSLYVVSTADGKVAHEIADVQNAFFSPDGNYLAFTLPKADDVFEMITLSLADGSRTSLGNGNITGWWPYSVMP